MVEEIGKVMSIISSLRENHKNKPIGDFLIWWRDSDERKTLREFFQKIANAVLSYYHIRHLPVYMSKKYKIKTLGLTHISDYYAKPKSIVLFPFISDVYIDYSDKSCLVGNMLTIRGFSSLMKTLIHELAHVVEVKKSGNSSHNVFFHKREKEIEEFVKKELKVHF